MIVVIPTVPHTGSRFVLQMFERAGFPEMRNPKRSSHGVIDIHIYDERIPELMALAEYPWIVPLRHPYVVAQTWKGRQKDLHLLASLWERVRSFGDKPHYLVIDSESRDAQLTRINSALGLDLKTNWAPVASHGLKAELDEGERALMEPYVDFYDAACNCAD